MKEGETPAQEGADKREDKFGGRKREDRDRKGGDRKDFKKRRDDSENGEPAEEQEDEGMTMEDFLNNKKAKTTQKAEIRKQEAVTVKNVEKAEQVKKIILMKETKLRGDELYTAGASKSENDKLLGF